MISIRKLEDFRWMEYRDLRLEALKNEPIAFGSSYEDEKDYTEDTWKAMLKNVIFALIDDKPVGMIVLVISLKPKVKHIANIFGIYVKKRYRQKGLGKLLLDAAISISKEKKLEKIKLGVNPEQEAAVSLYKKYGFVEVGRPRNELKIDGKLYDEILMEKYL